jgi:hypothetical protein
MRRVREHVLQEDLPATLAERGRGLHVVELFDLQHFAADDSARADPEGQTERRVEWDKRLLERAPLEHEDEDGEEDQVGHGRERRVEPLDQMVHPAAVERRGGAEEAAEEDRRHPHDDADLERDLDRVDGAQQDAPPLAIRADEQLHALREGVPAFEGLPEPRARRFELRDLRQERGLAVEVLADLEFLVDPPRRIEPLSEVLDGNRRHWPRSEPDLRERAFRLLALESPIQQCELEPDVVKPLLRRLRESEPRQAVGRDALERRLSRHDACEDREPNGHVERDHDGRDHRHSVPPQLPETSRVHELADHESLTRGSTAA